MKIFSLPFSNEMSDILLFPPHMRKVDLLLLDIMEPRNDTSRIKHVNFEYLKVTTVATATRVTTYD